MCLATINTGKVCVHQQTTFNHNPTSCVEDASTHSSGGMIIESPARALVLCCRSAGAAVALAPLACRGHRPPTKKAWVVAIVEEAATSRRQLRQDDLAFTKPLAMLPLARQNRVDHASQPRSRRSSLLCSQRVLSCRCLRCALCEQR